LLTTGESGMQVKRLFVHKQIVVMPITFLEWFTTKLL